MENYFKLPQQLLKSFGILKNFKILPNKSTNKNLLKLWPKVAKLLTLKLGKLFGLTLIKVKELSVYNALSIIGKNITFNE